MQPAQLLALGTDGLLYVAEVDDTRLEVDLLTRPKEDREVLAPVWGPDGSWLAWSESDGVDGLVRVMRADGETLHELPGFPAFCLDPSPDGSKLACLAAGPLGLELSVMDLDSGATSLVARGAPVYWDWAPSGQRMAVHVDRRLFVAELAALAGAVIEHDLYGGVEGFLCPFWSPGGSELITVDDQERLVVRSFDGEVVEPVAEGQATYRFAVDPTGQRVAYVDLTRSPPSVTVLDRLTGVRVVAIDEPVAGMWWSPDGSRLLSLVRAGDEGQPLVRWKVWDGTSAPLGAPFRPSRVIAETVLPFFEQFAPAHRFWAPDASAVVTTGITDGEGPRVVIQPTDGGAVRAVVDGVLAWWAPAGPVTP